MSDSPTPPKSAGETVGAALARWRKRKKISGQVLGDKVGMSQAKISRLETGVSTPDPQVVRLLAEGLDLPPDEVDRLASLAEHSDEQFVDWQSVEPNLWNRQEFVRSLEAPAHEVRVFQHAVVPGLLQTSEYARAILQAIRFEVGDRTSAGSDHAVQEAVAARQARSMALYETDRQFHFVIAETVLCNVVCKPLDMASQIGRLRELATLPNVSMRIIPLNARWPIPPLSGFELMGDKHVMTDLINSSLVSRAGRKAVRQHRVVFDALEEIATTHISPILDRYQDMYRTMRTDAAA
ncbi:helix-turn-helix transcriptional regulator [Actinoplanes sp. M2I2]|uniref:helix-turn-helix domain-containing protein n=1 Tax=Actinoplanes sp. M2I2 TaxID=1734444 RepID=UPI0020205E0A|nr:helix-turn-helix transcriptional regulator [Actinoplanes sp. M2I2]